MSSSRFITLSSGGGGGVFEGSFLSTLSGWGEGWICRPVRRGGTLWWSCKGVEGQSLAFVVDKHRGGGVIDVFLIRGGSPV